MNYLCLTADIINSRDSNNDQLLRELSEKLEEANSLLKPQVALSLNAGDELQGLWRDSVNILEIIILFQAVMHPLRVRIGIGVGTLSSEMQPNTREMRGEAFILARQALNGADKKHAFIGYEASGSKQNLLKTTLSLLNSLILKWDQVTYRRFLLYRESREIYSVAKSEGVSPEAINKFINRHNIRTVLNAIENHNSIK